MQTEDSRPVLLKETQTEGHRILSFWRNQVILPDGSFIGTINHDGIPDATADRGVILAARILWTYSRSITSEFDDSLEHRGIADRSFDFFRKRFWDPIHLGFYWMIDHEHHVVSDRKHIYAQAFAVYALAEYYAATGDESALTLAQLTYTSIEKFAFDAQNNGYFESFTAAWQPDQDLRLGPQDMNAPKSMNTHLHLLEAYTGLYHVWPNPQLRTRIQNLLGVIETLILDRSTQHYRLFFDTDWASQNDIISYGHDIEGSWLMLEAAECIHDTDLIAKFQDIAVSMVDAVIAQGLDQDYGLMNEGHGLEIVDDEKHWWPQAEAVVGCVNAYQITGEESYLNTAFQIWHFIKQFMLDDVHGEWFWKVSRDGIPDSTRPLVEPWKCPYHNTRACIEVWQRLTRVQEEKTI